MPVTVVIRIEFYGIICRRGIDLVFVGILSGIFCGGNDEDHENRLSPVTSLQAKIRARDLSSTK